MKRQAIAFSLLTAMVISTLWSCDEPAKTPGSRQTEGFMEGGGWVETSRRAVNDAIYVRYDRDGEYRWVVIQGLKSRVMKVGEEVPR